MARFTHAPAYSGHCSITVFNSAIAASISEVLEVFDMRPMISLCCRSSDVSCEVEMLGWAGSDGSIDDEVSFCWATEEGSVSGSNNALRMRASFADKVVLGMEIVMVVLDVFAGEMSLGDSGCAAWNMGVRAMWSSYSVLGLLREKNV
jgi:hypothetical protein